MEYISNISNIILVTIVLYNFREITIRHIFRKYLNYNTIENKSKLVNKLLIDFKLFSKILKYN